MSPCHLHVFSALLCQSLFVLPGVFLQANVFHRFTDFPYNLARQAGVVFWSPWGSGARVMSPHVHPGWKVRTLRTECSGLLEKDLPALFCMLELGQRWGGELEWVRRRGERMTEKDYRLTSEDKWQTCNVMERDGERDANALRWAWHDKPNTVEIISKSIASALDDWQKLNYQVKTPNIYRLQLQMITIR